MKRKDQPRVKIRPFPWMCPRCMKYEAVPSVIAQTVNVKHDGTVHTLSIPELDIVQCRSCGNMLSGDQTDTQISAALRSYLRLLTPEQIRSGRKGLQLQQRDLAERLGVAKAKLCRWQRGELIQSRAMDNLLRLYFGLPEVRAALRGQQQDPLLGIAPANQRATASVQAPNSL